MSYSLVLHEPLEEEHGRAKDVGENILLHDIPEAYRVFLFYYPAAMRNEDLENGLRGLGDLTGQNLLVNMGKLNDPDYDKIAKMFGIDTLPVVIMTAEANLAASDDGTVNAFVRLDDSRLLTDPSRAISLLEQLFGLFLRGEIAEAIKKATWTQRAEGLRAITTIIVKGLRTLAGFVADRDIKISFLEGSLELAKRGG